MTEKTKEFETELKFIVSSLKKQLPCCPNCERWRSDEETCGQVEPPQRPPATVIAFGCPVYVPEIPF